MHFFQYFYTQKVTEVVEKCPWNNDIRRSVEAPAAQKICVWSESQICLYFAWSNFFSAVWAAARLQLVFASEANQSESVSGDNDVSSSSAALTRPYAL